MFYVKQKKLKKYGKKKSKIKIVSLFIIVSCTEKMYLDQVSVVDTNWGVPFVFTSVWKLNLVNSEAIYLVIATRGKYISDIASEINRTGVKL